jgi:DNA-binding CsgD family transcriptional regulator
VDEIERLWPDPDRRDAALDRLRSRVVHDRARPNERIELNRRELGVLQALASGLSPAEAGVALGISHGTVKGYLKSARRMLGAKNTTQAVALAMRRGLIR